MRGRTRIGKSPTTCGERNPKKVARAQPTKNAEKATIVKALRIHFPLPILLDLIGLARSVFFYHLKTKNDKNVALLQP